MLIIIMSYQIARRCQKHPKRNLRSSKTALKPKPTKSRTFRETVGNTRCTQSSLVLFHARNHTKIQVFPNLKFQILKIYCFVNNEICNLYFTISVLETKKSRLNKLSLNCCIELGSDFQILMESNFQLQI